MENLLKPFEVFKYFKEICAIPHGSGDMEKISAYCINFAREQGLDSYCDDAKNVIIYKNGTKGYEDAEPIILQGHLDMVCQKTEDSDIDFKKDGLEVFLEGDFLKAKGTTLGADNGIAIAMIMAILADNEISHPPIEAVLTTDEEIGLIGAGALDLSMLKGKKMINLDSEEENVITVSCAGGSDFSTYIPLAYEVKSGKKYTFEIKGLKGGHSGVDINKCRVNADILAGRLLSVLERVTSFDIISINGGNKCNAIPNSVKIELLTDDEYFDDVVNSCFEIVRDEISDREKDCVFELKRDEEGGYKVFSEDTKAILIYYLIATPNGIIDMSANIEGLVETSLNLGILITEEDRITLGYALRSNKKTALDYLEVRLMIFAESFGMEGRISGRYEPWEYRPDSEIRDLYVKCFKEVFNREPIIEAIHAGLECSVFSGAIEDFDCISVGPDMSGVHTVEEKLSISSVERIYGLLLKVLENCK